MWYTVLQNLAMENSFGVVQKTLNYVSLELQYKW